MDDEKALVRDVLQSKTGAFAQLVKQYQKLVWHIVFRMLQNEADTEEVSQEVFLKVYQGLPQFRFESVLSTWIGRVAFSVANRHLSKRKLPLLGDLDINEDGFDDLESGNNQIESIALDKETQRAVHNALGNLPPLLRTLITLYHLDELSIGQISEIVDMPPGTVKSHLFRARKLLAGEYLSAKQTGRNYN